MLSDNRRLATSRKTKAYTRWYTDKEKMEAVKLYLITGNQRATAAALGIHFTTINQWIQTQWWKELSQQIRNEGHVQLSNKLKTIASKALDVTMDRLENGEFILNQKTGEMIRKPVQARDAHKIAVDFLEQSGKVEQQQTKEVTDQAVAGRLDQLAAAFIEMSKKTTRVEQIEHVEPVEQQALPG
jgi:transposase-like protein